MTAMLPASPGASQGGPISAVFPIDDLNQVGEVRRAAVARAVEAGLDETDAGTLALIATELGTNLARHARGGRILLQTVGEPNAAGIELLAVDDGPGIMHLGRALEDGFSTGGSAGQGLGAMQRLAGEFDIYTRTTVDGAPARSQDSGAIGGPGTALVARVWSAAARRERAEAARLDLLTGANVLEVGAVCVPLAHEVVSGDSWAVLRRPERLLVVLVDGLGHGTDAAVASAEAIRVASLHPDASLLELLDATHGALRSTRGAAMALAAIHPARDALFFAGVGNIAAVVHDPAGKPRNLASHNGTVGHVMRTVREFRHDWTPGSGLVMHSDGLNTRWRLDAWPGLRRHHPALVAGLLWRDATRGRDDAAVVTVQDTRR